MSAFHNQQTTADGIHILVRWEYTDVTAMYAAAYTAADDGGLARVGAAAPYNFYLLKDSAGGGGAAGWADVAQGTGDFSGPAASTAGHALAFADATGKLASDSGRVAANIPSSLPVGFADGGTGAATQQAAMEALSPIITHTAYVNGAYTGTGNGSVNAPFATISAALAFIGPGITLAEEQEIWVVEIAAGFYDESLNIPERRFLTLTTDGFVVLSDPTLATARTVTLNNSTPPLGALGANVVLRNLILTGTFGISGNNAGAKYEIVLDTVVWVNNGASPCIDSTGWPLGPELRFKLKDCRLGTTGAVIIASNTIHPQADVGLAEMIRCDASGGAITMGGYGHISACRFEGDMTWMWTAGATSGSNLNQPNGFFGCEWSNPSLYNFSAQMAGDFRLDAATNISAVGVNIGGGGAFTANPHKGLSNAYYPMGGQWVQIAQEHNMMKALDRLATVVQGLSGGAPIP
jgi:hypothetical protein